MESVLIEMGTATWSSGCANEANIIEQLKEDGYKINVINYHLNDPFSNSFGNQRAGYYNIQNIPHPVIGGNTIEPGNYDTYVDNYDQSFNTPSFFTISATGHFLEDTLFLEVEVVQVVDNNNDNIVLQLALVESDIDYAWHGQSTLNNVERSMSQNANGTFLDFTSSNVLDIEERFLFEPDWNPSHMELIAFIQDESSKEILQCHSIALTNFSPLPVHAFFHVEDTMSCRKNTIEFQNFSTGDIISTKWFFEGGIPEESIELNPSVQYLEEGNFAVKLVLSNSISSDTLLINDYIHVQSLPEMSFELLPDFCHNHIAHELTEGHPDTGNYFGLFVDTGYFHPEAAGIGQHMVYFTYQDEETLCSDTLYQEAYVHLCESINEIDSDGEFPLLVSNNETHLNLFPCLQSSVNITEINIYDFTGRLLKHIGGPIKTALPIEISVLSYNSYIIIHVTTSNGKQALKYHLR